MAVSFFLLIPSEKKKFTRIAYGEELTVLRQAEAKVNLSYYIYFPWPPLETGLSILKLFLI